VTTDEEITSGTERTYSTSKTEGTIVSIADTVTWNSWQESTESREELAPTVAQLESKQVVSDALPTFPGATIVSRTSWELRQKIEDDCETTTNNVEAGTNIGGGIDLYY
jgi:hypothetical protein